MTISKYIRRSGSDRTGTWTTAVATVMAIHSKWFLKYFSLPHGGPESDRERRDLVDDRYNTRDPCIGMKQILTGFAKWSDRYISSCNGQKNHSHQAKRLLKWKYILSEGKC